MLISYNWLKEHCDLPAGLTPEELGDRFKLAVVEVEKIMSEGESLEGVVVGKVVSAEKHPNADKLKICKVDAGNGEVQVVCGGSNVVAGMLIAFAPIGAKVRWHGEGELIELTEAAIRGEKSFGMICASTEIGLGDRFPLKDEKEILDLTFTKAKVGTPVAVALKLNDAILEIDNKSLSHRPDLWGHRGLAREAATLFNRNLKELSFPKIKPGKKIEIDVKVSDHKLCPRYMAVAISGVKVGPSPAWLQNRLLSVGVNPINNIVDITNYVMLDLGQPMHAFDASRVKNSKPETLNSKTIVVRTAKAGETIKALDGKEYKLTADDLVIADSEKPVAIAGVMGGEESGVSDATTEIIFESANFNAVSVRKTSTRLGLRSDSAQRFEKTLDPNLCELALQKAVVMALEICPGAQVASKVVDEKRFSLFTGPLLIKKDLFKKLLGVEIPLKKIVAILEKLGFEITDKKDELSIKIPTWRATKDIAIAEDVVEEVARIYGFENIAGTLPEVKIAPVGLSPVQKLQRQIKDALVLGLGYSEVYNYSFVSQAQIKNLGDDVTKYLELDNPVSKEKPFIRRNLLPNLLENIAGNISNRSELKLFEIGKVFHADEAGERTASSSDDLLPRQDTYLTAIYTNKKDSTPFWMMKLLAQTISEKLGVDFEYCPAGEKILYAWQHPERTAWVKAGGMILARAYELHPTVAESYGLDSKVGFFSLNLSELAVNLDKCQKQKMYHPISTYPAVVRDLAFVVDTKITHAQVLTELSNIDPLVNAVELFDVYEGKNLGAGKKSMAYSLTLLNPERTLESKEADAVMDKAVKLLEKKFGAEMRV